MTKRQIEITEKMKGFYSQFGEFKVTELKSGCIKVTYYDGADDFQFCDIIDKKGVAILGDDAELGIGCPLGKGIE